MLDRLRNTLGLDLRSLAFFRIVLAILLIWDVADRFPYAEAFYSDDGFYSIEFSRDEMPNSWSLNQLSRETSFQKSILIGLVVSAVFLGVGLLTRPATIICWVLLISVHIRNPMVLIGGDTLMRMLLFWSMFLPLGRLWSVDHLIRNRRQESNQKTENCEKPNWLFSMGTICLILQVCMVYWFTAISKMTETWMNGTAMEYVLRLGIYVRPFGEWMLQYPQLLKWITYATLPLELLGPLLLLIPFWQSRFRWLAIISFWALHLGIDFALDVGMFGWISMLAWVPFIPTTFWNRLRFRIPESASQNTDQRLMEVGSGIRNWAGATIAGFFLVYIVLWNTFECHLVIQSGLTRNVPEPFYRVGHATMVSQQWHMFGDPPKFNPWFVYFAQLKNGDEIDLLRNAPVDYSRPGFDTKVFKSNRWKKLHRFLLRHDRHNRFHQALLEYFIRKWNEDRPSEEQVSKARLMSFFEEIGPDYQRGDFIKGHDLASWEAPFQTEKSEEEMLDDVDSFLKNLENGGLLK